MNSERKAKLLRGSKDAEFEDSAGQAEPYGVGARVENFARLSRPCRADGKPGSFAQPPRPLGEGVEPEGFATLPRLFDGELEPESFEMLPKLCGADVELGNFILGLCRPRGTGSEASRSVLREIEGMPSRSHYSYCSYGQGGWCGGTATDGWGQSYDAQDWGRKFLSTNGGCVYIDLNHLELAIPEVLSAFEYVAAWHAMLRIVRHAWKIANEKLPDGQSIRLLVNNSDGRSHSYGSHLNFLITRQAWNNIFNRKLHYQLFLASYQVSSIVYTGQGKVGSENGTPEATFQLSQRADFLETLTGEQTTFERPVVNARDESLCGKTRANRDAEMARLHCIFFDAGLCHVASLLKVGITQIILAMIEAQQVDPRLLLDDPIDAVQRWSRDPGLRARAPIVSGEEMTAVELQLLMLDRARRFHDAGGLDGIVPRADEILELWEDTLLKLHEVSRGAGSLDTIAPRLDWALKLRSLKRVMERHPELGWSSPTIRHLDQVYGSLDPEEGLYWRFEASGGLEQVVSEADIEYFVHSPPQDTRAWTRALLLEMAGPDGVSAVDWDSITFRVGCPGYSLTYPRLDLANPLAFTKVETERVLRSGASLSEILEALGARETPASATNVGYTPLRYFS
jgi:hypothetical protein